MGNPLMNLFNMGNNNGANLFTMFLSAIQGNGNPTDILQLMMQQNPQINEAMNLIKGKTPEEMENICKTLCKQQGLDFNSILQQVKKLMGF